MCKLNQRLASHALINKELFVTSLQRVKLAQQLVRQPCDSGREDRHCNPHKNAFLGPRYTTERCVKACESHREKAVFEMLQNLHAQSGELIN